MYPISNALKAQLQKHTRVEHVRGTIGDKSFGDSNVISMTYSNRCSNTDDVSFGLAYIGQLTATFIDVGISRKNWKVGKKITLEWGVEYRDEDDYVVVEWLPVGVFYISSAEWTDQGVNVTANDAVSKLDKAFGNIQTSANTIGALAAFACQQCGLEFALTSAEAEQLPNGGRDLELYGENDVKTWRDYISWLACTAGGYVTATRDGKITIRSFADAEVVDTWGTGVRIAGGTFADYDTAYDGITYNIIKYNTEQGIYGSNQHGTLNLISIGANPFMQEDIGLAYARVLADVATGIEFTPFQTSLLSNLVYDLGDVVNCYAGLAGSEQVACCIMSIDWSLKELTQFKGFGADPSLSKGKSKTDKAMSGIKSQIADDKIEFTKYTNSSAITIGSTEVELVDVRFAITNLNDVEEWTEIKATIADGTEIEFYYYLDGQLYGVYVPEISRDMSKLNIYADGECACFYFVQGGGQNVQTFNLHKHLVDIVGGTNHNWQVTAKCLNGSASIAVGDLYCLLWAQGMLGEDKFGGYIPAEDSIPFVEFSPLDLFGTLSDNASVSFSGTPGEQADRITADGNNRITANGDQRVTAEE